MTSHNTHIVEVTPILLEVFWFGWFQMCCLPEIFKKGFSRYPLAVCFLGQSLVKLHLLSFKVRQLLDFVLLSFC